MLAGKLLGTIWYRCAWSAQHMNVEFGASKPAQQAVFVRWVGVLGAPSHGSMPLALRTSALRGQL